MKTQKTARTAAIYLAVNGLQCRRGGRTVFSGVSCEARAGDLVHLVGPNGSGKTTLLRVLAGLLPFQAGSIAVDAVPLRAQDIPMTAAFLHAGHQNGLKKILTLRDNCALFYKLMTGETLDEERLYKAADHFNLSLLIDQPVKFFSSGQAHRASLMRFMLVDRPIWLMDEPTVGLDKANRDQLKSMMQQHLAGGGCIIAASHDPLGLPSIELDMTRFEPAHPAEGYWS
ncbi:heme ABC exporter ATP-binding protein CcmA [Kordiimonas pumila]|uniref:Heme ABC exporter ATP-binding protein CcmA n=1 Tax=Kordiimonas pumila TaxID=2161677 RepID=A0ABV7D2T7_9PROT|nr:heme ABC exporter ATP-binding protein CcmA [Kordiimonas pumila]